MEEDLEDGSKTICIPGQRICKAHENITAGPGTYLMRDTIFSSLAGILSITTENSSRMVEVKFAGTPTIIPKTGDIVKAKIIQVFPKYAKCSIFCVDEDILEEQYKGILRKEDICLQDVDRFNMYKTCLPGDIIQAKILPRRDMINFHLSIADNELGVIIAYSTYAGSQKSPMIPVSWNEMQCPITMKKEQRKVAKMVF